MDLASARYLKDDDDFDFGQLSRTTRPSIAELLDAGTIDEAVGLGIIPIPGAANIARGESISATRERNAWGINDESINDRRSIMHATTTEGAKHSPIGRSVVFSAPVSASCWQDANSLQAERRLTLSLARLALSLFLGLFALLSSLPIMGLTSIALSLLSIAWDAASRYPMVRRLAKIHGVIALLLTLFSLIQLFLWILSLLWLVYYCWEVRFGNETDAYHVCGSW